MKKSRIRETKHLSTDADSSTNTTVGWTKNTKKPKFYGKTKKIIQITKTQKHPLLSIIFPQGFRISKHFGHPTSGSGGKKTFKWYLKSEQTDTRTDTRTF